jgi:hypothetical protein
MSTFDAELPVTYRLRVGLDTRAPAPVRYTPTLTAAPPLRMKLAFDVEVIRAGSAAPVDVTVMLTDVDPPVTYTFWFVE